MVRVTPASTIGSMIVPVVGTVSRAPATSYPVPNVARNIVAVRFEPAGFPVLGTDSRTPAILKLPAAEGPQVSAGSWSCSVLQPLQPLIKPTLPAIVDELVAPQTNTP